MAARRESTNAPGLGTSRRGVRCAGRARLTRRLACAAALAAAGCASTGSVPADRRPGVCERDPGLPGVWRSYRSSQLGPAWMTFTLGCDCSFRASARLLWARVREEGYYRTVESAIVFTRPGSKTVWPYKLAGADLDLQENGEIHRYRRLRAFSCPG